MKTNLKQLSKQELLLFMEQAGQKILIKGGFNLE